MTSLKNELPKHFENLDTQSKSMKMIQSDFGHHTYDRYMFVKWATQVLNILRISFGERSIHYVSFFSLYSKFDNSYATVDNMRAIFAAAFDDFMSNLYDPIEKRISGEYFGSLLEAGKRALVDGYKEVAAVLVCASLEDTLKKFAQMNDCDVEDSDLTQVLGMLKSKGLIGGSTKKIVESFPSIRNAAMHADWNKISPEGINSVIGFVEQLLIQYFNQRA